MDEKILGIEKQLGFQLPDGFRKIDVGARIVSPGFVDIHNHGGMGMMVAAEGKKAVEAQRETVSRKQDAPPGCRLSIPCIVYRKSFLSLKKSIPAVPMFLVFTWKALS